MSNRDWSEDEKRLLDRVVNYVVQNSGFKYGKWVQKKGGIYFNFGTPEQFAHVANRDVLTALGSRVPDDLGEILLDRLV